LISLFLETETLSYVMSVFSATCQYVYTTRKRKCIFNIVTKRQTMRSCQECRGKELRMLYLFLHVSGTFKTNSCKKNGSVYAMSSVHRQQLDKYYKDFHNI